nr:DDE-type integrase/transposase/recombinase [Paenactinomyces guangxiensis]
MYISPERYLVSFRKLKHHLGKQAQVDWGQFTVNWNGKKKRIYAFVMVLGYSRMMYLEFTENERLETLMGCHVRAMEYFGGRTETCLYDNMKTVVTGLDEGGHIVWNERFASFATHHGFTLKRCARIGRKPRVRWKTGLATSKKTGLTPLNLS